MIRRECLDWLIRLSELHLRSICDTTNPPDRRAPRGARQIGAGGLQHEYLLAPASA